MFQCVTKNGKLGAWVVIQRGRNRAKLTEDQVNRLNAAGFQWEIKSDRDDRVWREKLERLMNYKRKHGKSLVPMQYEEDPSLGNWVGIQRNLLRKNTLRSDRRDKLDAAGFVWTVDARMRWSSDRDVSGCEDQWQRMYEKLMTFQEEHQHCKVRNFAGGKGYESLGRWVRQRQTVFLEGSFQDERKKALDEIYFVWKIEANGTDLESSVNQRQWDEMFDKLVQFKQIHGHCRARGKNTPGCDRVLSMWVGTQLVFHRKETLNPQRCERLNSIGIDWTILE